MAEQIGEDTPDGVQRLLNKARWDPDLVRDDLRDYVIERLGDPYGVFVVCEVGFPKKGAKSAGIARQYNPSTSQVENCQVGVFLAYASRRGWAFIDRALYLPEEWAEDEERRREVGVPKEVGFATRQELAWSMLERALAAGVPAAWVTGGEACGTDEGLRRRLRGRGRPYVLEVKRSEGMMHVVDGVPTWRWTNPLGSDAFAWERVALETGGEDTHVYEWARGKLPVKTTPGWVQWLLVRRWGIPLKKKHVYYRAYSPEKTPLVELARAASTSMVVQEGLERAKREVGLDEYEVRRWEAWHRHVTLRLLAHASLQVTRAGAKGDRDA